jgi:hypothetical protein
VLENELPSGKFNGQSLSFVERLRISTHFPIAECWLERHWHDGERRDDIIGFFLDIFGNLYNFNLGLYFYYNQKMPFLQPVRYKVFHNSLNFQLLQEKHRVHLEHPLLLSKNGSFITTLNLGGSLKLFDLKDYEDMSWIKTLIEPQVLTFKSSCLAAACHTIRVDGALQHVIVAVLNNRQAPYVFVNPRTLKQFQDSTKQLEAFYQEGGDEASEITFCAIDSVTGLVVVSTVTQEI